MVSSRQFGTLMIALLPAVLMAAAIVFGLFFSAQPCCGQCLFHRQAAIVNGGSSGGYSVVVPPTRVTVTRTYAYGSSGSYSYGSTGGTPTQVLPLPRVSAATARLRSLLAPRRVVSLVEVPAEATSAQVTPTAPACACGCNCPNCNCGKEPLTGKKE